MIRGSGKSLPFSTTRILPGRSVKKIRPSGAKSMAQGAIKPLATTSILYGIA
ncbi:hypothetical protein AMI01nite_60310 [Aneurinibacillus migulanus]|nr:hypothetical protein AMI01nite_60310 [Aneurinibacillus migulanus]